MAKKLTRDGVRMKLAVDRGLALDEALAITEDEIDAAIAASKKGRGSRRKGAVGENIFKDALLALGVAAKRTRQRSGKDDADLLTEFSHKLHFECKFQKSRVSVYKAFEQAKRDSKGRIPVVLSKQNNAPCLISFPLDNLPDIVELYLGRTGKFEGDD